MSNNDRLAVKEFIASHFTPGLIRQLVRGAVYLSKRFLFNVSQMGPVSHLRIFLYVTAMNRVRNRDAKSSENVFTNLSCPSKAKRMQ